ncbi:MAG: hypothetical protein FWD69_00410 [Polyangiaceae bacterium]|nr:hypothetical protein [Polyangiaceae bacterium]
MRIRAVWTKESVARWEAPLWQWFKVLDQYGDAVPDDVAYWYNERATLSTLAGALWRSGGVVLEEYSTVRVDDGSRALESHGRVDLWCKIGEADYTIEAKQGYCKGHKEFNSLAADRLKEASNQCNTDKYPGTYQLAMVFIVPSLKERPTDMREWVDVVQSFNADLADLKALYLDVEGPQSKMGEAKDRYFPGVVLLARLVSKHGSGG